MNLICGINPVLEAISAGTRHFDRLLVVKGLRNRRISEAMARASQMGIPLRFEARETLDRMAGGVPHQGLIAVVSAKPVIGVEQLLERAHDPALLVVLDGVEDPRNLGAILRSVEAAGADGVLLPERHSAGLSESVSRSSAGALDHVHVARIGNVVQALDALKTRGFWVVGFDAAGTERWDRVDYRRPIALVLGGEGRGIRRLVRERCDHLVSIPLFGHVGSLNVSVAAGIALYEVVRQRGTTPSHVRPIPARASAHRAILGPGAGDQEEDPGRIVTGLATRDSEDPADGAAPLFVEIDAEEPAAWAGPTVLKAVAHRGRQGGERFHASRNLRNGRRAGRRPPPETAAGDAGADVPRGPREPGRGRRRRHGRQPPTASAPPNAPPPTGEPHHGPGSAPAAPRVPPAGAGRRRRRRRR